ncbi:MAG TPA: single-stranded DNA-binding protein, partial [Virgibacillus sp.]
FNIACNRPFKNQQGENEADFINCVTWRKQAENLSNYMKKGSMIGVDGRLQSRSYEGKDGNMVFVTEVVAESIQFLESRGNNSENTNSSQRASYQYQQPNNQMQTPGQPIDISGDDLPF